VAGFLQTDATIDVDGLPHEVTVPTDGDRMLWIEESVAEPTCEIVDTDDGSPLVLESPTADYSRDNGSVGDALGLYTIDPGSGRLQVTCGPE
ncbi:hypothetical protein, partial [Vibrio parahaemolyticus]|uniref:hypothetical protein n=1 Tax=Vibrio parahaemolyticus TaxID=670 RepID=UPI00211236A2